LGGFRYRAVATGTCSVVPSTSATITERKKPVVTVPPSAVTLCENNNATFTVTATGTGFTYQWQEDSGSGFGNITNAGQYSGATSPTLLISGVLAAQHNNQYQVIVTGVCAPPATSAAVVLSVNTLPVFTTSPADVTVCEGTGTSFTVVAMGTGVTYQWQEDSGSGFVNLTNTGVYTTVGTATLNISDVLGLGGYRYRAVATGTCSVVPSTAATLTERKKPVVTVAAVLGTLCENNNATFTVTATGTGLTYQWQEDSGSGFGNITNRS